VLEGVPRFGLFIGVGHPFRRDDGVGPWLADRLAGAGIDAVAHAGDGAGLIARFGEAQDILVADAMQGGRPPGSAVLLDARLAPMPEGRFRNSTHEFGLVQAVETARVLGLLPRSLWVLGIEGQDFGFGEGLSEAVERRASQVLEAILAACRPFPQAAAGPADRPERT
jgi:hydrogenase maturation protease